MQKIFFTIFVLGLFFPFFFVEGGSYKVIKTKEGTNDVEYEFEVEYEGFIPCGKCLNVKSGSPPQQKFEEERCGDGKKYIPCQFCHFFILISDLIEFFYTRLLWLILGALIAIFGFLLFISEVFPEVSESSLKGLQKIKEGIKTIFLSIFFLLILWSLIKLFFIVIGAAEWTGLKEWFKISCTVKEISLAFLPPEVEPPPLPIGSAPVFSSCPVDMGKIVSPFVCRLHPILHSWRWHCGIDIDDGMGTPIKAVAKGKVVFSGWMRGYGDIVIIKHDNGYSTRYAHLSSRLVSKGQEVNAGDEIGKMGNSGLSGGPHLHFEVRNPRGEALNPEPFLTHCSYRIVYDRNSPKYDWDGSSCGSYRCR